MFYEDLSRGRVGETYVKKLMAQRGHSVIDLTEDKEFQKKDVDLMISNHFCEVKTDYNIHKTSNLLLENEVVYKRNNNLQAGWFQQTEAEYLFVFDAVRKSLYIYQVNDLREFVKNNRDKIRVITTNEPSKNVSCFLVNKDLVPHQTIERM